MSREEAIEIVTGRVIDFYQPDRVYLFGSSARGDFRPDSDIDVMVVLPDGAGEDLRRLQRRLNNSDLPFAVQIVPWAAAEFDRRLHLRASFPSTIVREGRLLYDRVANRV